MDSSLLRKRGTVSLEEEKRKIYKLESRYSNLAISNKK